MPLLVMVAGPNGSGKSTLISALRSDPEVGANLPRTYVNADDIQKEAHFDAATAQRAASELRTRALAERRDFMYETVMSHPSKLAELQKARAVGYEVHVFFLATDNPAINVQRVGLRVVAGGHDVPEDRVRQRYERTLALAPSALGLADRAFVYDNSDSRRGLQAQAQLNAGRLLLSADRPAAWVNVLTTRFNERGEELAELMQRARGTGHRLHAADLRGREMEGGIVMLGKHYAVQQGVRADTLVAHDLALVPRENIRVGQVVRISYADGVGVVERLGLERS
jgi:predicted ABC-type ATPase